MGESGRTADAEQPAQCNAGLERPRLHHQRFVCQPSRPSFRLEATLAPSGRRTRMRRWAGC
eukprot:513571-Rhodomonas_salina.1